MKKIYRYSAIYALALTFALKTSSCSDFLQVEPTGSLTEEQVFEKIDNVEPLVLGLYKSYRGCKEGRNGLMPYLGTDETQQGNYQLISSGDQAGMDKYNGQLNPTSTQVSSIWNNRWPAVVSAAKAIYALGMTTEEPERAKQLMGEACFIRGLLMFELSMYWGEIPVIDMNRTDELGLGRQPLKTVWEYIMYVYPDCNYWEFDCGSRACDSWFGQGCSFSGYDFLVPTPFAYKTVEEGGIWEDGDLRKEEALRYDFTYYTNKYSEDGTFEYVTPDLSKTQWTGTTDELEPHIKKYEDYRTDILSGLGINNMWNSGKNFSMIRYADILLLHAECLNELGQTSEAVQIVNNQIRTRAWGGNLPEDKKWNSGMSKDEFRDKVMDERLRELCFEGWRRIDLLRTNKFVELIKERNRWAKESGTIQDFHKRYPIPDTEIKTNDAFGPEDQNPGYSK